MAYRLVASALPECGKTFGDWPSCTLGVQHEGMCMHVRGGVVLAVFTSSGGFRSADEVLA